MSQRYRVEIEVEDGWFIAHVPELQAHTQAETWDELLGRLREAIQVSLEEDAEVELENLVAEARVEIQAA